MSREIELKFRLSEPAVLRDRLRALGARPVRHDREVNHIFDTHDRSLADRGGVLRVREITTDGVDAATTQLTYKGPRENHAVKVREEIETTAGDAGKLGLILARVGFRETIRYEKRRETWLAGDCEVTVDELPILGFFGEIEGPSIELVRQAQRALAISGGDLVNESYIALAAQHGWTDSDGVCVLSFSQRSGE